MNGGVEFIYINLHILHNYIIFLSTVWRSLCSAHTGSVFGIHYSW